MKLYLECRRLIGETNKLLQAKDKSRMEKRRRYVRWRANICNNHILCGWIARDCERWKRDGLVLEEKDDSVTHICHSVTHRREEAHKQRWSLASQVKLNQKLKLTFGRE